MAKEYKVRNKKDAKIICARFTSRIEVVIEGKWFVAIRLRPGGKKNPLGYRIEFYEFPNLLSHQIIKVNTMKEARAIIKEKIGITMPKIAFDTLDAHKVANKLKGKLMPYENN